MLFFSFSVILYTMRKNKKLIIIFSVVIALTALIILNSVLFSVQHVDADCMNDEDSVLDEAIETSHGIRYGSSIFMLNENKAVENLKNNLAGKGIANIEIVSLERKFPNRVAIHYIKTVDYFYVLSGGQAYFFSNKGAVLTKATEASAEKGNSIELKLKGQLQSTAPGAGLSTQYESDRERADSLLYALGRLENLPFSRLGEYFEFASVAGSRIYIKTARGVFIEFSDLENFTEQFRHGLSAYKSFLTDPDQTPKSRTGTIIVTNTPSGVSMTYNGIDDRYGQYGR